MISAVIVLFNSDTSIVQSQYESLVEEVDEVIYIDNGSKNFNEIREILNRCATKRLPQFFIVNSKNMGLGFAQNQGIRQSIEHLADYVLLLDHDSVLQKEFIKNLCKHLATLKSVGAVGPIYFNEETGETYPITRYVGPFIKRIIPLDSPVKASMLISSGSLIPTAIFKEIGFMNEELFVDYIDVEWSFRAREKGYSLFAIPSAKMNHKIGDKRINFLGRMISQHSPLRRYYLTRNSIFMLKCPYISIGYKIRELTLNFARIFCFALLSDNKKEYLKYSIKGLRDGLKGKFGEASI